MKTSLNEVYNLLLHLIREVDESYSSVSLADIQGKHLLNDLKLDSLDILKLLLLVEENFNIKVPDKEIDSLGLLNLDNLANYLKKGAAHKVPKQ